MAVGATSASNIQMDYMKLLVTQLQNQNPLEPLSNQEMASQLSQFSQLEQLENMNSSFSQVLETTQQTYANSLIGKEVSFMAENGDGTLELTSGVVNEVFNEPNGEITLLTEGYSLGLDAIVSVKN